MIKTDGKPTIAWASLRGKTFDWELYNARVATDDATDEEIARANLLHVRTSDGPDSPPLRKGLPSDYPFFNK